MLDKDSLFGIKPQDIDRDCFRKIKDNWDHISKPIDGLGDFEDLICRIGAIQGREFPAVKNRAALIFCSDNGIVEEGVSQSGKEITLAVARALGKGISSACRLAAGAGVKVIPVDIGIDSDEGIEGVRDLKVAKGTRNFLKEPAMTEEEVLLAMGRGMELVKELKDSGVEIISTGEMGIGNTTTAAACLSALLSVDPEKITGRGAGLDDAGLERKKWVIVGALKKYDFGGAFDILKTLGGLDIAAMAGVFIGGAVHHVPVVIDGVISAAAACLADSMVPGTRKFMIASHMGREAGTKTALDHLGLPPYLLGNMALGEGTGAILLFPVIDTVTYYYENGAGFGDYEIDAYKRFG